MMEYKRVQWVDIHDLRGPFDAGELWTAEELIQRMAKLYTYEALVQLKEP